MAPNDLNLLTRLKDTVGTHNVLSYGAVGDGVTNDDAAFLAAVTAASIAGSVVVVPRGTFLKTASTSVPDDVKILGNGPGCRVVGPGFTLGNRNTVQGISFESATANASNGITFKTTAAFTNSTIRECIFTNLNKAIEITATATNATHKRIRVVDNYFTNCTYGIYQNYGQFNLFSRNIFDFSGTQRAILLNGGSYNVITHNQINGGRIGISLLYARNVSGSNALMHNIIANNTLTGVTEESISLDGQYNTAVATACFDRDVASAKAINGSSVDITATHANFAASGIVFSSYWLLFKTGLLAGQAFNISSHVNSVFTCTMDTTNSYPSLTVGDEFIVCSPFVGNIITGNTIVSAGTYAIVMWGLCAGNVVSNNSVQGTNISVRSLSSLLASTLNVTGRAGRGPSENNAVSFNVVRDASIDSTFQDFGSDAFAGVIGNELSHNRIINGKYPLSNILAQTAPVWSSGNNTPEGAVTAPVGSLFTRQDGGVSTTLYVKTSGTGNTGWTAK